MKKIKNYEKFNKGLFVGLIILLIAFIASVVWLSISQEGNAKLKAENKRLDIYNGILSTKLTERTLDIKDLQAQLKNGLLAYKNLETANTDLSNQVANADAFLKKQREILKECNNYCDGHFMPWFIAHTEKGF